MIIKNSNVSMDASRRYQVRTEQGSQTVFGWGQKLPEESVRGASFRDMLNGRAKRRGFDSGMIDGDSMHSSIKNRSGTITRTTQPSQSAETESIEQIRQQTLYYILQRLHAIFYGEQGKERYRGRSMAVSGYNAGGQATFSYSEYYAYEESEDTQFQTTGKVVTADGREIDFNVSLEMSRRFSEYYEKTHTITAVPVSSLCDPLIINLDDNIAEVSDQKFRFDLDADGKEDSISRLSSGSGFLALDQNGDGMINDGNELFGTKSGDGFADLAKYDSDGNGWIDEADPVFEKLKIWVTDADGTQKLYRLKEKGVGAICLENASTDFDLRSLNDNSLNARIRKTGVFLYENGNVGTVQHVDLAK